MQFKQISVNLCSFADYSRPFADHLRPFAFICGSFASIRVHLRIIREPTNPRSLIHATL